MEWGRSALQVLPGCDILGAFYSEKLPGQSRAGRIVVLNTNLYYSNNEQTAGMADPGLQFQWLEDVLTNASRAGEMVRAPAFSSLPLGYFLNKFPTWHNLICLPRDAHILERVASTPMTALGARRVLEPVRMKTLRPTGTVMVPGHAGSDGAEVEPQSLDPKFRALFTATTLPQPPGLCTRSQRDALALRCPSSLLGWHLLKDWHSVSCA